MSTAKPKSGMHILIPAVAGFILIPNAVLVPAVPEIRRRMLRNGMTRDKLINNLGEPYREERAGRKITLINGSYFKLRTLEITLVDDRAVIADRKAYPTPELSPSTGIHGRSRASTETGPFPFRRRSV